MAIKPGGGRTTGGSKKTNKNSPAKDRQLNRDFSRDARTIFHNAMKENGEASFGKAIRGDTIADMKGRYSNLGGYNNVRDKAAKDAAEIRQKRRAATQKGGASAKSSGGGGSRSDAVRKAWVTRRKNKGG